jgi:hypothetical protein
MRILLIEDEEDLAAALQRGLQRQGYAVDSALDGAAVLLLLSLLLRNGVAALLLYVAYWMSSMTTLGGIVEIAPLRRMTAWLLRFDFVTFAPEPYLLLQEHLLALWWQRAGYLGLTVVLLVLTAGVYRRLWQHAGQVRAAETPPAAVQPAWRRWFRRSIRQ